MKRRGEMEREDRIRIRAYEIWVAEGSPEGRERDHWEQAVAEVEASITDAQESASMNPATEAEAPTVAEEASRTEPSLSRRAA
jgi:hypothetical protein